MTRSGQRLVAALITAVAWSAGCAERKPSAAEQIAGTWIQVFPAHGALAEVTFRIDSTIAGSVVGLESQIRPLTRWAIGRPLMPDGFCVGDSKRWACQAYELVGDTLWLANVWRTTYLRSGNGRATPERPWDSPHRMVGAPTPPGTTPRPDMPESAERR